MGPLFSLLFSVSLRTCVFLTIYLQLWVLTKRPDAGLIRQLQMWFEHLRDELRCTSLLIVWILKRLTDYASGPYTLTYVWERIAPHRRDPRNVFSEECQLDAIPYLAYRCVSEMIGQERGWHDTQKVPHSTQCVFKPPGPRSDQQSHSRSLVEAIEPWRSFLTPNPFGIEIQVLF